MNKQKSKYFEYAILGHLEVTNDAGKSLGWETCVLVEPTMLLAQDEKEVQFTAVRKIDSADITKFGVHNIEIIIRPF